MEKDRQQGQVDVAAGTVLEESPFFKEAVIPRPEDVKDRLPVSLHLMVKNGGSVVGRLIDNVGPYVDEVVAILNDCTDDTEEVLRKHCDGRMAIKQTHEGPGGKAALFEAQMSPLSLKIFHVTRETHPELYIMDEAATYDVGRPLGKEKFSGPYTGKPILADWSGARNIGWNACSHPWRLFLDADDVVMDPECIPGLVKILDEQGVELAASSYEFSVDSEGRAKGTSFRERLAKNTPRVRWVRPIHEVLQGTTRISHVKGNLIVRDMRDSKGADIRIPARNFKILYHRARSRDWDVSPRILADLIMEIKQQPPTRMSVDFAEDLLSFYMRDATWPEERGWVLAMVAEMHEGLQELEDAGEQKREEDDVVNHLDRALELYEESLLIHPGSKTGFRQCRARFKKACTLKEKVSDLIDVLHKQSDSGASFDASTAEHAVDLAEILERDAWRAVIVSYDVGVANKAVHQVLDDGTVLEEMEKIHVAGALVELGQMQAARTFLEQAVTTFPENLSLKRFLDKVVENMPQRVSDAVVDASMNENFAESQDEQVDVEAALWLFGNVRWNDWCRAFDYAICAHDIRTRNEIGTDYNISDIKEIVDCVDGQPDGESWLGVFEMKDGKFLILRAGCDYSGWDCRADGSADVADTLDDAIILGLTTEEKARMPEIKKKLSEAALSEISRERTP